MQRLDHIEQLRCSHHYHSTRKIRAEYRMVYARSCICRMDRTHSPSSKKDLKKCEDSMLKFRIL